jgi:two-component system KDP operon response regulator KdpE
MGAKKRVLVVDDEPGVLRFINVGLSLAGYEVITSSSGEEALKLVKSAMPDIILLDLIMVPLSGFEVLEKLREFSQVPVIMFTARSDLGAQALKAGANGFIAKPFRPEQLVQKIGEFLGNCEPPA